MPDILTNALILPYRIQRRRSTIPLTTPAKISLPVDQLLDVSAPLSPKGDALPADTTIWQGQR